MYVRRKKGKKRGGGKQQQREEKDERRRRRPGKREKRAKRRSRRGKGNGLFNNGASPLFRRVVAGGPKTGRSPLILTGDGGGGGGNIYSPGGGGWAGAAAVLSGRNSNVRFPDGNPALEARSSHLGPPKSARTFLGPPWVAGRGLPFGRTRAGQAERPGKRGRHGQTQRRQLCGSVCAPSLPAAKLLTRCALAPWPRCRPSRALKF